MKVLLKDNIIDDIEMNVELKEFVPLVIKTAKSQINDPFLHEIKEKDFNLEMIDYFVINITPTGYIEFNLGVFYKILWVFILNLNIKIYKMLKN